MGRDRSQDPGNLNPGSSEATNFVATATARPSQPQGNLRILCVDDDPVALSLRGQILAQQGYSVTLDSSPLAALHRDVLAFDLAIVDYEMPLMNGVELLYAMRSRNVPYPIMLLSGQLEAVTPSQQSLFYRCFHKGQPTELLLSVIEEYVQTSKLPDYEGEGIPRYGNSMLR